jgi:hypothetical protein
MTYWISANNFPSKRMELIIHDVADFLWHQLYTSIKYLKWT